MCLGFVPNDGKKKLVKELLKKLFSLSASVQALSLVQISLLGFVGIWRLYLVFTKVLPFLLHLQVTLLGCVFLDLCTEVYKTELLVKISIFTSSPFLALHSSLKKKACSAITSQKTQKERAKTSFSFLWHYKDDPE